jgi:hypothetical protein
MLLDPSEQQLDLPAGFVKRGNIVALEMRPAAVPMSGRSLSVGMGSG